MPVAWLLGVPLTIFVDNYGPMISVVIVSLEKFLLQFSFIYADMVICVYHFVEDPRCIEGRRRAYEWIFPL